MDLGPEEFDLFTTNYKGGTTEEILKEQRAFEIWWRKQTGRAAIVVGDFEYKATLKYGDGK